MRNKTRLLFLNLLILTNSSFFQQSISLAPEATAAEVEATADGYEVPFWDIPILDNVNMFWVDAQIIETLRNKQ